MHRIDKRVEHAAILGLLLQLIFFGLLLVLFRNNRSPACLAASWQFLGGVPIWALIWVQLYLNRRAAGEREEADHIERDRRKRVGGSESVFSSLGEGEPVPMERRLALWKRWFVPVLAVSNAILLIYLAMRTNMRFSPMTWMSDAMEMKVENQQLSLMLLAAVSLICFLISRFTLGLSKMSGQRIIRAGANYIIGNAVTCAALIVVLALSYYDWPGAERVLAEIITYGMAFLAIEIVLNLLLDAYRPHVAEEEVRPIYESRVLGLFSEPEDVMRSIAHAVDYQFGFNVSETWFYHFFERALAPLILFGVITLYLMSAFVTVDPGERAVICRFGAIDRVKAEGLHLKLPWPIESVPKIYHAEEVKVMLIGHAEGPSHEASHLPPGPGRDARQQMRREGEPILWTRKHVEGKEIQILVASRETVEIEETDVRVDGDVPEEGDQKEAKPLAAVNILAGSLALTYQIKGGQEGLLEYLTNHKYPEKTLKAIAYRQWSRYMASVSHSEIMTTGRGKKGVEVQAAIQREADKRSLGLKVLQVGVIGLHPPLDIAEAYEEAINARQEKETMVWQAKGAANERIPSALAAEARFVREAMADGYEKITIEQALAKRFSEQLKGYQVAPEVFFLRHYLDMLVMATEQTRKFVVALEDPSKVLLIVDDKEKIPAGLLELGTEIGEQLQEEK